MIALQSDVRVYLACGYTDMRKGMQGLAMLVQQVLAEDPFNGALYALTFPCFGGHGLRPTRPLRVAPVALASCSRLRSASGGNCRTLR